MLIHTDSVIYKILATQKNDKNIATYVHQFSLKDIVSPSTQFCSAFSPPCQALTRCIIVFEL